MKCTISEHNNTGGTGYYHLTIFLIPETLDEGFELGVQAMRLRNQDIWCVIHDTPVKMLEVQVKR